MDKLAPNPRKPYDEFTFSQVSQPDHWQHNRKRLENLLAPARRVVNDNEYKRNYK